MVDDQLAVGVGEDVAPGGAVQSVAAPFVDENPGYGEGGVVVLLDGGDGAGELLA